MEIRPKRYTQDILSCVIAQKLSQSKRLGGEVQWYILRYTRQRWVHLSITQYISVYIGDFWNLKSPRKSRGLSRGLSLRRRSHPGTYPGTFTERYNMIYFYIKSIYWDILSSTWYILRCAQAYLHKLYGLVYTKIYFYTKTYLVQPNINWDIPWHTNHRPGYNTEYVQEGDPKGGPDIDELFDRPDAASMEGAINKVQVGLQRSWTISCKPM